MFFQDKCVFIFPMAILTSSFSLYVFSDILHHLLNSVPLTDFVSSPLEGVQMELGAPLGGKDRGWLALTLIKAWLQLRQERCLHPEVVGVWVLIPRFVQWEDVRPRYRDRLSVGSGLVLKWWPSAEGFPPCYQSFGPCRPRVRCPVSLNATSLVCEGAAGRT